MNQRKIPAVYMRGGTSRCLVFHERDLPAPGPARDAILLAALGSPDPNGRQLDGLGGGISSLSKAVIIGPPTLPGADVDYTFAQVEVKKAFVDYAGNCGNCSSSVGPFAIDEGLVAARDGETLVRIHNTNTKKMIVAHVPVADGEAAVAGDFELAGRGRSRCAHRARLRRSRRRRHRTAAAHRPRARRHRGSRGLVRGRHQSGRVRARARSRPDRDRDADGHRRRPRRQRAPGEACASRRRAAWACPSSAAVPKIAFVAAPADFTALDGIAYPAAAFDLLARVISMGNCHRAFPLTVAMCLAVAARIDGTVVNECVANQAGDVRLGHPSGVLPIAARVSAEGGEPKAETVTVYRTARRLMEGFVRVP